MIGGVSNNNVPHQFHHKFKGFSLKAYKLRKFHSSVLILQTTITGTKTSKALFPSKKV